MLKNATMIKKVKTYYEKVIFFIKKHENSKFGKKNACQNVVA